MPGPFENPNRPSPNHTIERFATPVTVYPHGQNAGDDHSEYADDSFGDPVTVNVSIRPADAMAFRITDLGQTDEGGERLYANVPASETDRVSADDSVDYDGTAWRFTERQHASRYEFDRYRLIPDTRRRFGRRS